MTTDTIGPGVYPGLSMNEYNALPWLRSSRLGLFHQCPAAFEADRANPTEKEPTRDMIMGSAIHLLCEGATFPEYRAAYPLEPDPNAPWKNKDGSVSKNPKNTAGYKDAMVRARATPGLLHLITRDEDTDIQGSAQSLKDHPYWWGDDGEAELSLVFDYESSQGYPMRCKMRPDRMGPQWLGEIKKTNKDPSAWAREFYERAYWIQLGLYTLGYEAVAGEPLLKYRLAVVNSNAPYAREIIDFHPDELAQFKGWVTGLLDQLALCDATDEWPRGSDQPLSLTLEPWMVRRLDWLYGGTRNG